MLEFVETRGSVCPYRAISLGVRMQQADATEGTVGWYQQTQLSLAESQKS